MKKTVYREDFHQAFKDYDREDNFSHGGRNVLFDHLEEMEIDTREEIELDVIALCCDYTEYTSLEEFQGNYDPEEYATIEDIQNATTVIMIDDEAFIIQAF